MDLFSKCSTDQGYFGWLRKADDRTLVLPVVDSVPGTKMSYNGVDVIMWSINNYLGLANNEKVKQVALDTVQTWSTSGPMGSRFMSGNTSNVIALENELADHVEKESSMLSNYGYLGVQGTIDSLVTSEDIIISDRLSHASIVDGARISKADVKLYQHNNMNHLEDALKSAAKTRDRKKSGILIVTEGVWGMTGDVSRLDQMCDLKEKYGARLFVDDAHGYGVMGRKGRGTGDFFDVQDRIDLYFSTFAKSFASIGGFTAGNKEVTEWIRFNARTQLFARGLPMVIIETLRETLRLVINGDDRRKKVFENSAKLKKGLRSLGYYVHDVESPITPLIMCIDPVAVGEMVPFLRNRGVFTTPVAFPVVPEGMVLWRLIPTADHTDEDINKTLEVYDDMKRSLNVNQDIDMKLISQIYH